MDSDGGEGGLTNGASRELIAICKKESWMLQRQTEETWEAVTPLTRRWGKNQLIQRSNLSLGMILSSTRMERWSVKRDGSEVEQNKGYRGDMVPVHADSQL